MKAPCNLKSRRQTRLSFQGHESKGLPPRQWSPSDSLLQWRYGRGDDAHAATPGIETDVDVPQRAQRGAAAMKRDEDESGRDGQSASVSSNEAQSEEILLKSLLGDGPGAATVLAQRPLYLGAMSQALGMLKDVKSTHGFSLIVKMRAAAAHGRRPITWGEAHDFLVHRRGLSPAGSKKTIRRLVQLKLVIPAPSPCIDKAKDLLATRRLAEAMPVIAQPYTVYRRSGEGDLERKKFDVAWLDPERLHLEDTRLAEWLALWRAHKPSRYGVPSSLTPFFASPLSKRPSPTITGVVSVAAERSGDYEILLCDGPAREDPAFMRGAEQIVLKKFKYKTWQRALRADFEEVKLLSEPIFHHLKGKIGSHPHDYFRLVLPIASDGENVDCVLVVVELTSSRVATPIEQSMIAKFMASTPQFSPETAAAAPMVQVVTPSPRADHSAPTRPKPLPSYGGSTKRPK